MKKILWTLSVVLVMAIATGAYADIRSDKCNTHSNDLGINATIGNYSGDICAGCLTNVYLLDKDIKLPYRALLAGMEKERHAEDNNNGSGALNMPWLIGD